MDLFNSIAELFKSIENIGMISIFVRQFPNYISYKTNNITNVKYLRYHVENYLSEIYIFYSRIKIFLRFIEKRCKKYNLRKLDVINKLLEMIDESFKKIVDVRGNHVHVKRFDDDTFDRLSLLDLFTRDHKDKMFGILKKINYQRDRSKWSRDIQTSNRNLSKLLNIICEKVDNICFSDLKKLINS